MKIIKSAIFIIAIIVFFISSITLLIQLLEYVNPHIVSYFFPVKGVSWFYSFRFFLYITEIGMILGFIGGVFFILAYFFSLKEKAAKDYLKHLKIKKGDSYAKTE